MTISQLLLGQALRMLARNASIMKTTILTLVVLSGACGAAQAQMNPEDYPPLAMRQHHEGHVAYRLTYGADGRATSCTVTSSSGFAELDETTCNITMKRTKFALGRTGTRDGAVDWHIPQ
jgi:TonB family protein